MSDFAAWMKRDKRSIYTVLADPADFVLPKIDLSIGILKKEL